MRNLITTEKTPTTTTRNLHVQLPSNPLHQHIHNQFYNTNDISELRLKKINFLVIG